MSRRSVALLALGLVPPVLLAVTAGAMHLAGLTGVDAAAHAYKIDQLRHGLGALFWDSSWYGGTYGVIDYGPFYYLCALLVPGVVLVVLAAGSLPLLTHLYLRRTYGVTSYLPAVVLTGVLCLYLSNGQDPFLFALAFMMGALVLLAHERRALAALAAGLALFSNPLALLVGGVFLVADFIARRELRRSYLVFLAWLAPFLVARGALTLLFAERAAYLDDFDQVVRPLVFALAAAALAWATRGERRRHLVTLFLTYAVVCLLALAIRPLPLGNNVNRFFMVFAVPLLAAVGLPRLPSPRRLPLPALALAVVVGLSCWQQFATPVGHLFFPPGSAGGRRRLLRPGPAVGRHSPGSRSIACTWWRSASTGRPTTSRAPATPSRAAGTGRRTPSTTACSCRRATTRPVRGLAEIGGRALRVPAARPPRLQQQGRAGHPRRLARLCRGRAAPATGPSTSCASPGRSSARPRARPAPGAS